MRFDFTKRGDRKSVTEILQTQAALTGRKELRLDMAKEMMRAVIFKGAYKIELVDRPVPQVKDDTDIIVKVMYSALCGSEMHVFRGHQPSPTDFIMGHEFTGTVEEVGSAVKNFKKGDQIVSPFTVSWYDDFVLRYRTEAECWVVETAFIARMDTHRDALMSCYLAAQHWMERRLNTCVYHWRTRL